MKYIRIFMLVGGCCFSAFGNAQSTSMTALERDAIYVSPQGRDRNSGNEDQPLRSLGKAFKLAKPGQTIYLRGGRYHGTEKLHRLRGKKNAPITVMPYPGEQVIFDGTQAVTQISAGESLQDIKDGGTGWQHHQGNIYKMQLQQDVWQLFVLDDNSAEQMMPARWPNAKFSDGSIYSRSVWATARNALKAAPGISTNPVMNKIKTGISAKQVVDKCFEPSQNLTELSQLQQLDPNYCYGVTVDALPEHKRVLTEQEQRQLNKQPWKKINNNADLNGHDLAAQSFDATGAMAILNYGHWRTWARPVVSHQGGKFTHIATPHLYGTGHYYYLENALSLLDQQQEWFFDKQTKTLYLWAPNDLALNQQALTVRGKVQANAFEIKNAEHLVFKNLEFFATAFTCNQCDEMTFDGLKFEYAGSSRRMLGEWASVTTNKQGVKKLLDATPDIVQIIGKHTRNSSKSSNSVIRNSVFRNSDGPALQFHGNDNKIINNRFVNIDYNGVEGWPFQAAINTFGGKNNTFSYNSFYNTGLSQMYRADSGDITHNYVDKIGWAQTDGAVIGANSTGLAVAYNWALSDHDKGIRIDAPYPPKHVSEWNTDNYIHHNVTMFNRGIVVKGWKHRIYNNTVVDIGYTDPVSGQIDPQPPRLILNNDVGLLARHKVSASQLGCDVGVDCGANLQTISANNLSPYILAGLGKRIERRTKLLATQHHDFETSVKGGASVSELLRDPANYDFRAKAGLPIASKGINITGFSKTKSYSDYQGLPCDVNYIGAYSASDTHYNIPGQRQKLASFPIPFNGSTNAKKDSDLMWREALAGDEYRVFFGSNKQAVTDAVTPSDIYQAESETFAGIRASNNIYNPGPLTPGQSYYWRVDTVTGENVHKGAVWRFTVER